MVELSLVSIIFGIGLGILLTLFWIKFLKGVLEKKEAERKLKEEIDEKSKELDSLVSKLRKEVRSLDELLNHPDFAELYSFLKCSIIVRSDALFIISPYWSNTKECFEHIPIHLKRVDRISSRILGELR